MKAVLLALLLLLPVSAWSQSPSTQKPVPPVSSEAQGASKSKNNPSQEQPTSSNLPTSIDLNVTGKLKIESKNSNEKADPESNKWLDPVSILTGLLVVVTGFLAKYTYQLWQTTSNLAIDARNTSVSQAADMKSSLSIAKQSADAASESVRLAREEFIATHRPKILVRGLKFTHEGRGIITGIQYTVHNAGDSEGFIYAVSERLWLKDAHGDIREYRTAKRVNTLLKSGGHITYTYVHPDAEDLGFQSTDLMDAGCTVARPMFIGFIEYKDQMDTIRRTAFLRQYDPPTKRFVPANDTDYEYTD